MDHCIKLLEHHEKFSQNQKKYFKGMKNNVLLGFTGYTHSKFLYFCSFSAT